MLNDLPSDPDAITVRIRLEPARGARSLSDTVPPPAARAPLPAAVVAAAALAALAAVLVALA
jgi:hypothetical protein